MKDHVFYLFGGAVLIGVVALGYWVYQDRQRAGIDISIGGRGITIQER